MKRSNHRETLRRHVDIQARRMKKAERERATLLAHVAYMGTLGLVFVLPVVGGAYLGSWLDGLAEGYSVRWTVSMMCLGLVVGGMNVYFLFKEKG